MKFYPLREVCDDPSLLEEDYRSAREIGVIRTGKEFLFFRVRLRHHYMPYAGITRCFRRVLLVPASMCCGMTLPAWDPPEISRSRTWWSAAGKRSWP